jgi:general secretion pathway protein A
MLLDHYGLREQPFGVTPNPRYLYLSPGHREALASLVYGVESGRGFLALIAPPGMGKTTLLFQLLDRLGKSARTVFLFQTQCGSRDFLRSLMADLGVRAGEDDMVVLQAKLNEILIKEMRAGRKFVLVVDEAQNLEDSALEFVRMLSNFETPRAKLMQIILAGQPQLAEKLARPAMVQLRQRISMLIRLRPLEATETAEYVEHRLRVAGHGGPPLFSGGALGAIASESGGIPRNINNICFNALSLGYAAGRKTIDAATVQEVAADLDLRPFYVEAPASVGEQEGPVNGFPEEDRARAEGWAVLLDRIFSPSRDTGASPGFGSKRRAARPRGRGPSWTGAEELGAGQPGNRLMN